jgi:hypothetical protein
MMKTEYALWIDTMEELQTWMNKKAKDNWDLFGPVQPTGSSHNYEQDFIATMWRRSDEDSCNDRSSQER